jgi:hypothetical protein
VQLWTATLEGKIGWALLIDRQASKAKRLKGCKGVSRTEDNTDVEATYDFFPFKVLFGTVLHNPFVSKVTEHPKRQVLGFLFNNDNSTELLVAFRHQLERLEIKHAIRLLHNPGPTVQWSAWFKWVSPLLQQRLLWLRSWL